MNELKVNKYFPYSGIRSRITIGQIKEIILHSEDENTKAQFLEILCQMINQQIMWCKLMYEFEDKLDE